ncbi:hypothetical protein VARIO8X_150055 [Burkholderiales bacterium 8X]|nr:hypothetical protein VARIO8X_150055 [Burkholderiales bacterium 8X]
MMQCSLVQFLRRRGVWLVWLWLAMAGVPAMGATTVTNTATIAPPPGVIDSSGGCDAAVPPNCTGNNRAEAVVQVWAASTIKSANPASGAAVAAGGIITYTLAVSVTGAATTQDIVLTDTLDAGLQFQSITSGGAIFRSVTNTNPLVFTLPAGAAANATYSISYTARVLPSAKTSVKNAVTGGGCVDAAANCGTSHPVGSIATVKSSVPSSGTSVLPGSTIQYTVTGVNAQANLKELGWVDRDASVGAWTRKVDGGYSVARNDTGLEIREYGAQARGHVTDTLSITGLQSKVERGTQSQQQTQATAEWRPTEDDTVSVELRRITQQRNEDQVNGTLGAVKYARRIDSQLDVYGIAQVTLDKDNGRYPDNDAITAGARYRFGDQSTAGVEATHGDRGDAAQITGEYRLTPEHSIYGAFTHSTDTSEYDSVFNPRLQGGWTLGQRWRLSEKTNLFNESQYIKDPNSGNGIANTFGMDFYPSVGWSLGFSLQDGKLESSLGEVRRHAVSVNAGRISPITDWRSKIEWRRDGGAEQRTQWVTTNRVNHKLDDSWRLSAKFNYSDTEDRLNAAAGARFVETGVGFAWRPHDSSRYALMGRYTYLYDLAALGQVGASEYDQKSSVFSLEGTYKLDRQWEFAAKLARRNGEARFGRGTGQWFDSATNFASAQVRYQLPAQWSALAEYRVLDVKDGGLKKGWLIGADHDLGKNLRVGVGYNFTDFNDDLTKFDYRYRGFFINLVGSY